MTVFISWSGAESKHVAAALRMWLPNIIQGLDTFMSESDIPPGVRWFSDIASQLEGSNYGVICVTPGNQESPWLNFEAGAIGKQTEGAYVTPFAVSMKKEQIVGPLSGFNAVDSNRDGFLALVKSINRSLSEHAPEEAVLAAAEVFWPRVEEAIGQRPTSRTPAPAFEPNAALKEIRELVRQLVRDQFDDKDSRAGLTGSNRRAISKMDTAEVVAHLGRLEQKSITTPSIASFYRSELFRRSQAGDAEAEAVVAPIIARGEAFVRNWQLLKDPLDP
jgi:hypothetical protein